MKKISYLFIIVISFSVLEAKADRFTLFTSEIFIGELKEEYNRRYVIDRFGYTTVIPNWWVKKVEKGITDITAPNESFILSPTKTVTLMNQDIVIHSKPPVEISHVQMYPKIEMYGYEMNRYLRGYLVNNTLTGYERLSVRLRFYSSSHKVLYECNTEIFKSYPFTAKPFAVDTRFLLWDSVHRIEARVMDGVKMKPRAPYYHLN